MHGEHTHLSENNPARHAIQSLWNLDYGSVQNVSDAVRKFVS